MLNVFLRSFNDEAIDVRGKIVGIYSLLVSANLLAWIWALMAFGGEPVLIGTAVLAYSLGLRHAIDADHIAAIDNVTRTLMQEGKRPVAVVFFFSLGHSTVVVLASIAVAVTATAFKGRLESFHAIGNIVGTSISAAFLLLIALINVFILINVYKVFQRVKKGGNLADEDLDILLSAKGGLFARIFWPLFCMIASSWHMYPLGFLFGLGFDTATEIGLLGISAAEASDGLSIWSILAFPALFTAGMTLIDTTDSILMLGAYGWAFVKPLRKLYYNMTITFVSIVVALIVDGIETLGLIGDEFGRTGVLWDAVISLNDNFGVLGYLIIGIFVVSWLVSVAIYRLKGYSQLEILATGASPALR